MVGISKNITNSGYDSNHFGHERYISAHIEVSMRCNVEWITQTL